MHLAGYFANILLEPVVARGDIDQHNRLRLVNLVRLWGLFHDIGHGPFSHSFDSVVLSKLGTNHEKMSLKMIGEDPRLADICESGEFEASDVSPEEIAKAQEPNPELDDVERAPLYVLKGPYNVDVADFLLRDSYHCGTPEYGTIGWQRLFLTSLIKGDQVVLEERSKASLLQFYRSRHMMFNTVYFHRTCRAANRMLTDILEGGYEQIAPRVENLEEYSRLDEGNLLSILSNDGDSDQELRDLIRDYLDRCIPWRESYEKEVSVGNGVEVNAIRSTEYIKLAEKRIGQMVGNEIVFFVDGPSISDMPLYPFGGVGDVKLYDPENDRTYLWSQLPELLWKKKYTFWFRVFIDKDSDTPENMSNLKKAANEVFEKIWPTVEDTTM